MRFSATVTSLSWIPVEAITGVMKLPMTLGISHYDDPPPEVIDDLEALRQADKFRFANELTGWIEVEDGAIVEAGYAGGGHVGATTLRLARKSLTVPAVSLPDLRSEPEITDDKTSVRLVQTAGGRTGAPMPRTVHRPPFIQISSSSPSPTPKRTSRPEARRANAASSSRATPSRWAASATSRYRAPLSSRCQPSAFATRLAMVPFPEPLGPSIAITGILDKLPTCPTAPPRQSAHLKLPCSQEIPETTCQLRQRF